jgi:hypothetical protein
MEELESHASMYVQAALEQVGKESREFCFLFDIKGARYVTHVQTTSYGGILAKIERTALEPLLPHVTVTDLADMLIKNYPSSVLVCEQRLADELNRTSAVLLEHSHRLIHRRHYDRDVNGLLRMYVWQEE